MASCPPYLHIRLRLGMFYSSSILAPPSKSLYSAVFFLAVAPAEKKLCREAAESISICSAVHALLSPPVPFSLRLLTVLLKGISRAFLIKARISRDSAVVLFKGMHWQRPIQRASVLPRERVTRPLCNDWILCKARAARPKDQSTASAAETRGSIEQARAYQAHSQHSANEDLLANPESFIGERVRQNRLSPVKRARIDRALEIDMDASVIGPSQGAPRNKGRCPIVDKVLQMAEASEMAPDQDLSSIEGERHLSYTHELMYDSRLSYEQLDDRHTSYDAPSLCPAPPRLYDIAGLVGPAPTRFSSLVSGDGRGDRALKFYSLLFALESGSMQAFREAPDEIVISKVPECAKI